MFWVKNSSFFMFMFKRLIHKLNCVYFLKCMMVRAQVKAETRKSKKRSMFDGSYTSKKSKNFKKGNILSRFMEICKGLSSLLFFSKIIKKNEILIECFESWRKSVWFSVIFVLKRWKMWSFVWICIRLFTFYIFCKNVQLDL